MAEAIILEFKGMNEGLYNSVNDNLGIDSSGKGDWPRGLQSHFGAMHDDSLVVFEVWESKAHQEEFMNTRLGAALAKAGVPQPTRVEWFSVIGEMTG